jgi:hypothetical protein
MRRIPALPRKCYQKMRLRQWLRGWGPARWNRWPEEAYRKESYRRRLLAVQEHLARCLDVAPHGPLRLISMCAGDGRDVIGVLRSHHRRPDVSAWLVELNRHSAGAGARQAARDGLAATVRFLSEDATAYATYQDIAPADVVLLCGVWGHVPAPERGLLVRAASSLCKPGGMVIWTRGVSRGMTYGKRFVLASRAITTGQWLPIATAAGAVSCPRAAGFSILKLARARERKSCVAPRANVSFPRLRFAFSDCDRCQSPRRGWRRR